MKKLLLLFGVGVFITAPIQAQQSYPRAEIFGGYSYLRGDLSVPAGWNASVAVNAHRNIGVEADFSGHYGSTVGFDHRTHLFLAGPKFTARIDRFAPYAHVLIGATRVSTAGQIFQPGPPSPIEVRGRAVDLAWALGGGLDIKIHKNIAVRAIQADYLRLESRPELDPSRGTSVFITNRPSNNVRLSFGVVLRLGGS